MLHIVCVSMSVHMFGDAKKKKEVENPSSEARVVIMLKQQRLACYVVRICVRCLMFVAHTVCMDV